MASLNKLVAGQIIYDVRRQGGRLCTWQVRVIKVDLVGRRALISWNSNKPNWCIERHLKTYRVNDPSKAGKP